MFTTQNNNNNNLINDTHHHHQIDHTNHHHQIISNSYHQDLNSFIPKYHHHHQFHNPSSFNALSIQQYPTPTTHIHSDHQPFLIDSNHLSTSKPPIKTNSSNPPNRKHSTFNQLLNQNNRKSNVLHRNKACLSCRARKTKCDALKPSCTSCKRLGPDQESQCKYDRPPKWLESVVKPTSDAQERKKVIELEQKLDSLQKKLSQLRLAAKEEEENRTNGQWSQTHHDQFLTSQFTTPIPLGHSIPTPPNTTESYPQFQSTSSIEFPSQGFIGSSDAHFPVTLGSEIYDLNEMSTPLLVNHTPDQYLGSVPLELALAYSQFPTSQNPMNHQYPISWPSLTSSPCSSYSNDPVGSPPPLPIQQPTELLEQSWPQHLPYRRILKLLLRTVFSRPLSPFSLINPGSVLSRLDLSAHNSRFPEIGLLHALSALGSHYLLSYHPDEFSNIHPYWYPTETPAQYHAEWAGRLLSIRLSEIKDPDRLLELSEASMMLSQYFSNLGRPLLIWKWLGFSIRICCLLGINEEEDQEPDLDSGIALLWDDGIKGLSDHDPNQRKLMWWYLYCCERVCAGAGGFAKTIREDDCTLSLMGSQPQFLRYDRFFIDHQTDGNGAVLQLLIKGWFLFFRIERQRLNKLIGDFFESIPAPFRDPFQPKLNICQLMGIQYLSVLTAHATAHSSIIELNEEFVKSIDLNDLSLQICSRSARVLIDWFNKLDLDFPSVDFGSLLSSNSSLNFTLTVALRTQCRLIGFYEALGEIGLSGTLRDEVKRILVRLQGSRSLPMAGKSLEFIKELLNDPTGLFPRRSDTHTVRFTLVKAL
ncbi:uncharacterized protein MELLADRAFT_78657 [Melampsora larici-populina 98AG31]|uniref:Zn(2)-C6 fungal-type domain-containing protein n=1 Tax=Melampsora larici-populina (strain 98AG31 / pathotype 3-4-7) TaxID=747676 RepID=F4RWY0_MELLP|nr:uncharacterized protein MELLADRAFT_78657 [Melampsora larici-populina 98AG31]EGG03144.1 hypothetical protein MELLADRAFT_78657 [Melampsora larici-populina 98AG31]